MLQIDFDKIHEQFQSSEQIRLTLDQHLEEFKFRTKIYRARHYSDLAHDYLEASFIGDQLCQFSDRIEITKEFDNIYDSIIVFSLKPKDTLKLSEWIFKFGQMWSGQDEQFALDFVEDLNEYREAIEESEHFFPELLDDYYSNYINGEYYEYDPIDNKEFFENEFSRFPERQFGFNKSAYSRKIKQDFYSSVDSLIVPKESDLDLILKSYSGIENITFIKADFFAIGNISYLISQGLIIHFPFDSFLKAKHCAQQVLVENIGHYTEQGRWMDGFLAYRRSLSVFNENENYKGYPEDLSHEVIKHNVSASLNWVDPTLNGFYLSSYGDHILVKDSQFSYFFFGTDKLSHQELNYLGNNLSSLFRITANLAGFDVHINCPWQDLNDESFEELCYDIIYHNPKFDNSTIRKMGKSKSRDGGRDITVSTHSRPGESAKKYIFQCKHMRSGSSLTGSKVQDIADTVIRYEAHGYGIMTNVTIDSTLYDKLDGLSKSFHIKVEDFSVYKLERILAGYPHLKERYFNQS